MRRKETRVSLNEPPTFRINRQPISIVSGGLLKPPLLTFIVVNWNYGQFIGQTIDSIRAQDYPHFECLVVDNASTDESLETIARHVGDDVRFTVEALPENMGQLGAALWALQRTNGGFVSIVDADDFLFPNFASSHLQVHLALPRSVALTSSNIVEVSQAGTMLTGGYLNFHTNSKHKDALKGLRDAGSVMRLETISDDDYLRLHKHTAILWPTWNGWLWAPGSSNVFRRSLLNHGVVNGAGDKLLRSADGHFIPLCHALGGTALIDVPLCGYRHHGANYFAKGESLAGLRQGTRQYEEKARVDSRQTLEVLLQNVDRFGWQLANRFWPTVDQLTRMPKDRLKRYYRDPGVEKVFTKHVGSLVSFFGENETFKMLRARYDVWATRRIFKQGLKDAGPLFWARFWLREFNRRKARWRRSTK
jgi:glycosyltransferase involved in cell wall biosynthesis